MSDIERLIARLERSYQEVKAGFGGSGMYLECKQAAAALREQAKRIEELERKLAACMGFNVTIKPSKESIAALPDGLREYITEHLQFNGEMNRLEKENANLQAELTRLRKEIIKDASDLNPHTPSCPNASLGRSAWSQIAGCTCWKSKALEGKEGE